MHRRFLMALMLFILASLLALTHDAHGERPEVMVYVDVSLKRLSVWQGMEEIRRYPIATGAWDTPTPLGTFRITSRFSGEMGGFGTCFLGLNVPWGTYGIHGTNKPESIGLDASHGCIRLEVAHAEDLYRLLPNGTVVIIADGPYGEWGHCLRALKNGDRNSMVCALQRKLKAMGYYGGWPDGIWGTATEKAVQAARKAFGLPPGEGDWALYHALGLTLFE